MQPSFQVPIGFLPVLFLCLLEILEVMEINDTQLYKPDHIYIHR